MNQTQYVGIGLLFFGALYILLANQAEVITGTLGYLAGGFLMLLGVVAQFAKPKGK